MSNHSEPHISSYSSLGLILVILLFLTFISVFVAELNLQKIAIIVAMVVASIKATIVLTYFMHLKFENTFIRAMVGGVFLLFAIVIAITFIDYLFR